jgi:hypothetical protein
MLGPIETAPRNRLKLGFAMADSISRTRSEQFLYHSVIALGEKPTAILGFRWSWSW